MRILRRLLGAAVFVAFLIGGWKFAAANQQLVPVHLLAHQVDEVRLWLVVVASFGAGALVTLLLCSFELVRKGLLARRYRKALRSLESELHGLRSLPLAAESGRPEDGPEGAERGTA